MSDCLLQSISLTTEPIWFSFTVKLIVSPGKVSNYFSGVNLHIFPLPIEIIIGKIPCFRSFPFKTKCKVEDRLPPPPLCFSSVPLQSSSGIAAKAFTKQEVEILSVCTLECLCFPVQESFKKVCRFFCLSYMTCALII